MLATTTKIRSSGNEITANLLPLSLPSKGELVRFEASSLWRPRLNKIDVRIQISHNRFRPRTGAILFQRNTLSIECNFGIHVTFNKKCQSSIIIVDW